MKHATKLFLVVFFITLSAPAFTQTFGVKAGLNLANQHMEEGGETLSDDFDTHIGFHVGVILDFPVSPLLSFETGAIFTTKGFSMTFEETFQGETIGVDATVNLYYVDVPLTVKFNFLTDVVNVYGKVGPYVGIGLSGKISDEFAFLGETESSEEDISWGSTEDDHYKRLDYGLTAGLGVQFYPIRLGATYDLGLANIASVTDNDAKINNRVIRISLAYLF